MSQPEHHLSIPSSDAKFLQHFVLLYLKDTNLSIFTHIVRRPFPFIFIFSFPLPSSHHSYEITRWLNCELYCEGKLTSCFVVTIPKKVTTAGILTSILLLIPEKKIFYCTAPYINVLFQIKDTVLLKLCILLNPYALEFFFYLKHNLPHNANKQLSDNKLCM